LLLIFNVDNYKLYIYFKYSLKFSYNKINTFVVSLYFYGLFYSLKKKKQIISNIYCFTGFTLVVSPMVSLMEDQIIQMEKLNVNAKMISSYSSKEETTLLFQVLLLMFISVILKFYSK